MQEVKPEVKQSKDRIDNLEKAVEGLIKLIENINKDVEKIGKRLEIASDEIAPKDALRNHQKPFSNFGPIPRDKNGNILDENLKRRIESGEVVITKTEGGAIIIDNVNLSQ